MRVGIITDTHFGARNGKEYAHAFYEKFFSTVFFPTLAKEGIDTVLHLGDVFDTRKYLDYYSLKRSKEYFFEPLAKANIKVHMLVGNHDIALRNSLEINSPDLVLSEYKNINPISKPTYLELGNKQILMLPWICSDNYVESIAELDSKKADYVMAHAEISGFAMFRGMESHEGFEARIFSGYDKVFSGHYHHRSSKGNITYLGNPYEMTWSDYNDPRGFHIFDTETQELTFFENPYTMFKRVVYNDATPTVHDFEDMRNKFVKVVVESKNDYYSYDLFLDKVLNSGAIDVKVMENLAEMAADELDESVDIEDTQTILKHFVDAAEVDVDRNKLSTYISNLYLEALHTNS
jgi:DNA repair exonuclease SbcCD nuclease subunit